MSETVRVRGEHADIQFYDAARDARSIAKYDTKPMWRGNHTRCSHAGGTCIAARAWIIEAGTWLLRPHVIPVNIEERAMGMVSYPGQKGRFPESTQTAKGMVDWSPALENVRPTNEVIRYHLDRHLRDLKSTLEKSGAKYGEVQAEMSARRESIESANGLSKPKKAAKPNE